MADMLIQHGETMFKPDQPNQHQHSPSFDLMHVLRIIFYILVIAKLFELSFLRRKKHNLKERVYRKFLFAHQEILKQFSEEDKAVMENTLNNTIKNASIVYNNTPKKVKKSRKRVNFTIQKNTYYEPKEDSGEHEELFLDIDENQSMVRMERESFQERKVEDEFKERKELIGIDEQIQEVVDSSKVTQETQASQVESGSDLKQVSELSIESKTSELSLIEQQSGAKGQHASLLPTSNKEQ